jgi:hypothetical protein
MKRDYVTDLNYENLKARIIKSYSSGEMDNTMNQMGESLRVLDKLYTPERFRDGRIEGAKVRLLTEIQTEVDRKMGVHIYSDMWE